MQADDHVEIIIIGAGVIGLAIAKTLTESGREVLILEKEKSFGMGISSRNSEVIHAGLYFAPDMLKTTLCVSGKKQLYEYANDRHIPHKKCGKLLLATNSAECEKLQQIKLNAEKCGIDDLQSLTKEQCEELEPDISAVSGIYSPSSGVIDSHSLMLSLLGDAENAGGQAVFNTTINAITQISNGFLITTQDGFQITSKILINAAGLGAMNIAHMIDALDKALIPELIMAKGHYFSYSGKTNFKHLVYPVPFQGGLGVHLTLDMAGGVKFGPDVEFTTHEEYNVNPDLKDAFLQSIKRYFPDVDAEKLYPDYAGIRPKLSKDGKDFLIQFAEDHDIKGLINLFGMESPGLTSCLAIADYVMEKLNAN